MKKINLMLVLASWISSWWAWPLLPEIVPIHWNIVGEADNWAVKDQAVWLWPLLVTGMWLSFQFLPKFDPKKEKYVLFNQEWEIIQASLIGFMMYMQIITFYVAIHPAVPMLPLLFTGLGTMFIVIGNYLSKIRQNYFIGFKLPWTLANEENWNKTHRFASWWFVVVGIVTLIEAYANWYAPVIIFSSILLAVVLPTLYSFLLYRKWQLRKKSRD